MIEATYHELFNEHLEERMRCGGNPDYVITLVRIYEGLDETLRNYGFHDWVRETSFKCGRCGTMFRLDRDVLSEGESVLCARCEKKS